MGQLRTPCGLISLKHFDAPARGRQSPQWAVPYGDGHRNTCVPMPATASWWREDAGAAGGTTPWKRERQERFPAMQSYGDECRPIAADLHATDVGGLPIGAVVVHGS